MKKVKKAFQPLIALLEANKGKKLTDELFAQCLACEGVEAKAGGQPGGTYVQVQKDGQQETAAILDSFQGSWYTITGYGPDGVGVSRKATKSGYNTHTNVGAVLYGKDRKLVHDLEAEIEELNEQFFEHDAMSKDEFKAKIAELNGAYDSKRNELRKEIKPGFATREDVVKHLTDNGFDVVPV